ncbi:MAG TPA: hypothetical protein VFQ53_01065 [Kofleriaceae bacterium]|nr:hypothetical protein [Kofleriaceae bacterium]
MTGRIVCLLLVLAACGRERQAEPEHVPARWREVRASTGHEKHIGKVACVECHAQGFEPPGLDVCTRCHEQTSTLHHNDATAQTPTCTECHDFAARTATAWSCMSCHDRRQGSVAAVGAHADQPCAECHQPHQSPATVTRACTECHADKQTQHAGLRGCRDCHAVHEDTHVTLASIDPAHPAQGAASRCEQCHAAQPGKLRVDAHALTTGHPACTSCHAPHSARGFAARPCAECHANQPVLAATRHACTGCHAPHAPGPAKPCTSCHREQVAHPNPTKSPRGACLGCHPVHDRQLVAMAAAPNGASGLACTTCHAMPSHATATCRDCHAPHAGKPALTVGLCASCHASETKGTANTGHAKCLTCHTSSVHGPQGKPPTCASCHDAQTRTAPSGHANCAQCHAAHAPKPVVRCATCHAEPAARGHGPRVACASCHRPHGPGGPARPPACTSCHARPTLAGLHQAAKHADCASCHHAHEQQPSDDRATCTSCHTDRKTHEPTAKRCATCHPFR